jgi:Hemerythrin HHE cation binding domain
MAGDALNTHGDSNISDHGQLLRMLSMIERAGNGETLAPLLADFHPFLRRHFQDEERPNGFFDSVTRVAPRHAASLDVLRAEHRAFLDHVARLQQSISPGPISAATRDDVAALVAGLRRHEALEGQLLMDSQSTDLGGSQ